MSESHRSLFSVIVPVYNTERYLDQCVQSILGQTFRDFELILIVKDSGDRCTEMCDSYASNDSRVKSIHQMDSGVVNAQKIGAQEATGKYAVVIQSDDWVSPEYLQRGAEAINKYSPDILCCGRIVFYKGMEDKQIVTEKGRLLSKEQIEKEIYPKLIEGIHGGSYLPAFSSKFIRLEIYRKYQVATDNRVVLVQDYATTRPCFYASNSIYLMPEILYYLRYRLGSLGRSKAAWDTEEPRIVGQYFEKYIDMSVGDFQDQVYRMVVHQLFNASIAQFYRSASWKAITSDISNLLEEPYYKNAISKCRYQKYWKGELAHYALRKKNFILMYLYNHYRNLKFRHRGFEN